MTVKPPNGEERFSANVKKLALLLIALLKRGGALDGETQMAIQATLESINELGRRVPAQKLRLGEHVAASRRHGPPGAGGGKVRELRTLAAFERLARGESGIPGDPAVTLARASFKLSEAVVRLGREQALFGASLKRLLGEGEEGLQKDEKSWPPNPPMVWNEDEVAEARQRRAFRKALAEFAGRKPRHPLMEAFNRIPRTRRPRT